MTNDDRNLLNALPSKTVSLADILNILDAQAANAFEGGPDNHDDYRRAYQALAYFRATLIKKYLLA